MAAAVNTNLLICKWKTEDECLEVRIEKKTDLSYRIALVNLLANTSTELGDAAWRVNCVFDRCVEKTIVGSPRTEGRLFRHSVDKRATYIDVNTETGKFRGFNWTEFSDHLLIKQTLGGHNPQTGSVIWIDRSISRDESHNEKAEMGIIRGSLDGSEKELIHVVSKQGMHGNEDIKVFRRKIGDREELISEVFHRTTKDSRPIELIEVDPNAAIRWRTQQIQGVNLAKLGYSSNGVIRDVFFKSEDTGILFAKGKSLGALSDNEIRHTLKSYLVGQDTKGTGVASYDEKTFSVRKYFSTDLQNGTNIPIIHIHLQRNSLIRTVKPLYSFIEQLLGIGDAKEYEFALNQYAMEDLVVRNSNMDEGSKQIALENFRSAFVRCASIDIKIACDRSKAILICDDQTWVLTTAKIGGKIKDFGLAILERFAPTASDFNSPLLQNLPYRREGELNE